MQGDKRRSLEFQSMNRGVVAKPSRYCAFLLEVRFINRFSFVYIKAITVCTLDSPSTDRALFWPYSPTVMDSCKMFQLSYGHEKK